MFRASVPRILRGAPAAILLGCLACAPGSSVRRGQPAPAAPAIRVVVENNEWHDMNVYLETATGSRFRLGTVDGLATRTFVIRTLPSGGLWFRLVGDPIGDPVQHASDEASLDGGVTAHWRVGQTEATSWLTVR